MYSDRLKDKVDFMLHPYPVLAATVESRIIEQCAMSLELPPLVGSGVFFVFFFDDSQRG